MRKELKKRLEAMVDEGNMDKQDVDLILEAYEDATDAELEKFVEQLENLR